MKRIERWLLACCAGSAGCIFDDVQFTDRDAVGVCALVAICIVLYGVKCYGMSKDKAELES